jgi:hypothetical protein
MSVRAMGAAAVVLAAAACGGDTAGPGNPSGDAAFTARIDGTAWETPATGLVVTGNSNPPGSMTIVGTNLQNPATTLMLILSRIPGPGTYPLGINVQTSTGGVANVTRGSTGWSTPLSGAAGTVTITSITDTRVVGSFSFGADAVAGSAAGVTVTNGQFNVARPSGFVPATAAQVGSRVTGSMNGAAWNAATIVTATDQSFTAANTDWMITFIGQFTAPGTYPLSVLAPPLRRFTVQRLPSGGLWGGTAADQGSITVTSVSATRMTGTYSVTLAPSVGTGPPLAISNGTFDIRFGP